MNFDTPRKEIQFANTKQPVEINEDLKQIDGVDQNKIALQFPNKAKLSILNMMSGDPFRQAYQKKTDEKQYLIDSNQRLTFQANKNGTFDSKMSLQNQNGRIEFRDEDIRAIVLKNKQIQLQNDIKILVYTLEF